MTTDSTTPTETLNQLGGGRSLQALYDQGYDESFKFEEALRLLWNAHGHGNRNGLLGAFQGQAIDYITTHLFDAVDPNNKVECFLLGNAMVNVDSFSRSALTALQRGEKPKQYSDSNGYEISGHTRWVFEQAAKRFKGTTMGAYSQLALNAKYGEGGNLFLYTP